MIESGHVNAKANMMFWISGGRRLSVERSMIVVVDRVRAGMFEDRMSSYSQLLVMIETYPWKPGVLKERVEPLLFDTRIPIRRELRRATLRL